MAVFRIESACQMDAVWIVADVPVQCRQSQNEQRRWTPFRHKGPYTLENSIKLEKTHISLQADGALF